MKGDRQDQSGAGQWSSTRRVAMLVACAGALVIVSASAVATAASSRGVEGATSVESSAVGAAEVATVGSSVADSAEAPASTAGHPLVGVWWVTDPEDPEGYFVGAFSTDGIYHEVDYGGATVGAWESTGPNSAAWTTVRPGEGGAFSMVRGTIEVNPDGQGFTAEYTFEVGGIDGSRSGEYGPVTVTGARITVEPIGTPVGTLDDFFAELNEGTGTGTSAPPTTS